MTKVEYKRLRKVWGWAYIHQDRIELYHGLKGIKHLEILLHEKLHLLFQDHDEKAIRRISKDICKTLWKDGYRKI